MDIAAVIIISGLYQVGAHYFPWESVLKRELPRPAAYVIGVIGMIAPALVWMASRGMSTEVLTIAGAVAASGLAVIFCYLLDATLTAGDFQSISSQLESVIRNDANEQ